MLCVSAFLRNTLLPVQHFLASASQRKLRSGHLSEDKRERALETIDATPKFKSSRREDVFRP